jgi:hypothetical protein
MRGFGVHDAAVSVFTMGEIRTPAAIVRQGARPGARAPSVRRIQNLEAQLIVTRRTPADMAALVERVEENVRTNIRSLRAALTERPDLRDVFHTTLPKA